MEDKQDLILKALRHIITRELLKPEFRGVFDNSMVRRIDECSSKKEKKSNLFKKGENRVHKALSKEGFVEFKEGDTIKCPKCKKTMTWVCIGEPEREFFNCEHCNYECDENMKELGNIALKDSSGGEHE